MDPLLIIGAVVAAIVALYFIVSRSKKARPHNARDDATEPRELTGEEQYKRRKMP